LGSWTGQRFGVRQKERITSLKTTVDVLTLSATPIPRTLYLALSGFRDASLITTPPAERRPIVTHLLEFQPDLVKSAVNFELTRGGQVFYVVPRVKGIEETKAALESYFPHVGIAIAHGQQSAYALEESMERFAEGETLILLCTSIVESGLDIRRVNTIIVEDIHLFGLAQLYQLRGRVGRADREAHAYMFHPRKELLSDDALERLVALEECCGLGQGFQLAERDMAIRGIGSVFGEKQSGDVGKVGVDLYLEMLFEGLKKVDHQNLPELDYSDVQVSSTASVAGFSSSLL
jgi:transcription-repair coupling factor (superfamily II helicase)